MSTRATPLFDLAEILLDLDGDDSWANAQKRAKDAATIILGMEAAGWKIARIDGEADA